MNQAPGSHHQRWF